MTYPTIARLFYLVSLTTFFGGAILLESLGLFKYLGLVVLAIVLVGAWLSRIALRCPVCGESVGRSKHGFYGPWIGPLCRYCGADLSQRRVSLRGPSPPPVSRG